jgi:hypothetical protein
MKRVLFICAALLGARIGGAQQVADSSFDVSVAHPAFVSRHPRVAIDEAHLNFHTASGRYLPFANLLRNDGLRVQAFTKPFSAESLRDVDVLVIANALGAGANAGSDTSPPAFTDAECDAVRDWVRSGGALLLISDHTPFGAAAENLASRFGMRFGKGFVLDSVHAVRRSAIASGSNAATLAQGGTLLVFERSAGLLGSHPILAGRDSSERIGRVLTFTGQSVDRPLEAVPLLILPSTAREAKTRADLQSGVNEPPLGHTQGIAMSFGAGRVVTLGEAAFMSAQLAGPANGAQPRFQMGMNQPGSDDRQFALNVVRWLARVLN